MEDSNLGEVNTFLSALLGEQPAHILTEAVVGTPLQDTLVTRALASWISVVGSSFEGRLPGTDTLVKFERDGLFYCGSLAGTPLDHATSTTLFKSLADLLGTSGELPREEGVVAKFCRSLDCMVQAAWTLEKTSKNVKQKRAEITRAQADQRRERYARSLGLDPQKVASPKVLVDMDAAGVGSPQKSNRLGYGGQFILPHEVGHAMFTPRGKTTASHQRDLGRRSRRDEFGYEDDAISTSLEYKLDRRAGVDPHKFNETAGGGFRGQVTRELPDQDQPGSVEWDRHDPDERRLHRDHDDTARAIVGKFDAGRRFDEQGRVRQPNTLDARISLRGRRNRGFAGAPRPANATRIPTEKQLSFQNFDFRPAPATAEKSEMAPAFVAPRKADQPTPPVGPKQPRQPRAPKPPGGDDVR